MVEILHDRFRLLKKCGSGGSGEVFQARDLRLERLVAIKRVKASGPARGPLLEQLRREASNLARIEHPNVVVVHDVIESESSVSIIMELVKGKPFLRLFLRRPIPEKEFLVYFRQLIASLEAVHGVGIVHRDVNPRNVLVSREGVIKLTDFGLSGAIDSDDLRPGGTLGYMAPEVVRQQDHASFAVDIWSLGFMAYQALLGIPSFKKLYASTRPRDWVRWVLSREPFRTLVELDAPVSPGLSKLIARMLEKDPACRYSKIAHVRRDLDAHLSAEGSQSRSLLSAWLPRGVDRLLRSRGAAPAGSAGRDGKGERSGGAVRRAANGTPASGEGAGAGAEPEPGDAPPPLADRA